MNKFLSAGDKCKPEMHLRQPGFKDSPCGPFTKCKERTKSLQGQGIQNIFIKTMIWFIEILKINVDLWFINFLIRTLLVVVLKIFLIKN